MKRLALVLVLLSCITVNTLFAPASHAAAFDPSRIMDDAVFDDWTSMTADQIQEFLGYFPNSCLKNYTAPYPTDYYNYGANVPASQVIKRAADLWHINPKVILTTLEKEESLVTGNAGCDDWRYNSAVGMGCPDSGTCPAPAYAGFSKQVTKGMWQLKFSKERAYGNVAWNDDGSVYYYGYMTQGNRSRQQGTASQYYDGYATIDGSSVYMSNGTTAALYTYTPHFHGNENFSEIFTRWFGGTYSDAQPLSVLDQSVSLTKGAVGQPITFTYSIKNPLAYDVVVPSVGISNRMNGGMYDYGINPDVSLAAGETKTFSASFVPVNTGTYSIRTSYNYQGQWYIGPALSFTIVLPSLQVTQAINTSPEFPLVNQASNISFTIKNTGDVAAHLAYLMAANMNGATANGYKALPLYLAPGQTYTYEDSRVFPNTTNQEAWIAYQLAGGAWYKLGNNLPYRAYSSPASVKLTSPVTMNPTYPIVNKPTQATFKIKNFGDQPIRFNNLGLKVTRDSDSQRFDFNTLPAGFPLVLKGGQEYTYNESRTFPTKDSYSSTLTSSYDGTTYSDSVIPPLSDSIPSSYAFHTYNSPSTLQVTQPLAVTPSAGPQSQIVTLSYTLKNTGDAPTGDIAAAFYCRFQQYQYCDIPGDTINLAANESHTVTRTLAYFAPGTFTFRPLKYQGGIWQDFDQAKQLSISSYTPPKSAFTTTLAIDKTTLAPGEPTTVTYTIKNNTPYSMQLPVYAVAARLNGQFYDFGIKNWFYLQAGETKSFTATFSSPNRGTYTLFPVLQTTNDVWYGYDNQSIIVQ